MADTLTPKQEAFCQAFIRLNDQSAAYREAYVASGMKPMSVNALASRLMAKVHIRSRVAELRKAIESSSIMTAKELQEWWSQSVKGEHVDADYRDQLKASELLGRSKGVFVDRQQLSGPDGGPLDMAMVAFKGLLKSTPKDQKRQAIANLQKRQSA
jgi:hypothetical protein